MPSPDDFNPENERIPWPVILMVFRFRWFSWSRCPSQWPTILVLPPLRHRTSRRKL